MSKKNSKKYADIRSFLNDLVTSAQCYQYVYDLKWSDGYSCLSYGHDAAVKGRKWYYKKCQKCTYDESCIVHSVCGRIHITLHSSKLTNFEDLHWYIFNLKNWIKDIHHHVSKEHRARYLCEHNYRFNNCNYTGDGFLRCLKNMMKIPPLSRQIKSK